MLALELQVVLDTDHGVRVDGMDILRETLEVLAGICDRARSPAPASAPASAPAPAPAPAPTPTPAPAPADLFFFNPRAELYGALHGGRADHAVLVCAPPGQDGVRSTFVVQRLARELAARGIPCLRFDLYGSGDSRGRSVDASFARWQRDVADARAELVLRTGATRVTAVGVRLGATLLAEARRQGVALSRLVLWDPVADGAAFEAELARLHDAYVRSLVHLRLRPARAPSGGVERMGLTYSRAALAELRRLQLLPLDDPSAQWLVTSDPARQRELAKAAGARALALDVDCGWDDLARLEDLLPDAGVAKALAAMVEDPS
jgi:pimeloyl-ACP methyl ester carboxylesterase